MDQLLPWLRRTGFVYVAVALLLAALAWRVSWGSGAQSQPEASSAVEPVVEAPDDASRSTVVVHVAGAVRKPGIYEVPYDARVHQAVRRAGGPTAKANTAAINLAASVQDGQQIVVPHTATPTPGGSSSVSEAPISLSSATVEQLQTLDGVGPTLAARIVEWRQSNGGFSSVDQLMEVPGIGEGRLAALRGKVSP